MKKLGLISVFNYNYGSLLQTYAMQNILNSMGIENEIIFYKKRNFLKQIARVFNIPLLVMKGRVIYRKWYCKLFQKELSKQLVLRDSVFEEFIKSKLRRSEPYVGRKALETSVNYYSAFLLGSDQVWNPINLGTDYYTMNWIPDGCMKITYAPSFGVGEIPFYQIERTKKYLKRIQYLSVREQTGSEIIKNLTERDVPVVCDPTLLIDRTYWDELKGKRRVIKEKYIFCYFLGSNPAHREFANRFKSTTGYKLVALQHLDEFVKDDITFADIKPFDVGPEEFVNLVSNAEFVLTDSFHGTIFSILYHKKFFTLSRHKEKENESTNSRLSSLMKTLEVSTRRITGQEIVEDIMNWEIDYERVYRALEAFKSSSLVYLKNALEGFRNEFEK